MNEVEKIAKVIPETLKPKPKPLDSEDERGRKDRQGTNSQHKKSTFPPCPFRSKCIKVLTFENFVQELETGRIKGSKGKVHTARMEKEVDESVAPKNKVHFTCKCKLVSTDTNITNNRY